MDLLNVFEKEGYINIGDRFAGRYLKIDPIRGIINIFNTSAIFADKLRTYFSNKKKIKLSYVQKGIKYTFRDAHYVYMDFDPILKVIVIGIYHSGMDQEEFIGPDIILSE